MISFKFIYTFTSYCILMDSMGINNDYKSHQIKIDYYYYYYRYYLYYYKWVKVAILLWFVLYLYNIILKPSVKELLFSCIRHSIRPEQSDTPTAIRSSSTLYDFGPNKNRPHRYHQRSVKSKLEYFIGTGQMRKKFKLNITFRSFNLIFHRVS